MINTILISPVSESYSMDEISNGFFGPFFSFIRIVFIKSLFVILTSSHKTSKPSTS